MRCKPPRQFGSQWTRTGLFGRNTRAALDNRFRYPICASSARQSRSLGASRALQVPSVTAATRWLHKYLVLKCTGADLLKPFSIHYATVKRDSGLLNDYSRERAAIEALEKALKT
jgi:hypothetical protein